MDAITGLNIPMLIEVFAAREHSNVEELAQITLISVHLGIKTLKETLKNNVKEEEL